MPKISYKPIFDGDSLTPENHRVLATHRSYISDPVKIDVNQIQSGDVIQFMYDGEDRTVFVLNPSYKMKLHGLSMKTIDRRTMMVEVFSKLDMYKSPSDFYERVISRNPIKKTDSYRTYEINKMGNIHKVTYQIDERGREEL